MSGRAGHTDADLLFCHQCEHEWRGQATGLLLCPRCHSEFIEVVEHDNDPRHDRDDIDDPEAHSDRLPHNPLHHIHPWPRHRQGSDEGNIEHVEWNPSPGIHFSRTSYRSSSPSPTFPGQRGNDPFSSIFQSLFDAQPAQHTPRRGSPRPNGFFSMPPSPSHHRAPWQPSQPAYHDPSRDVPGYGPRNTFTSTTRVWPSPTNQGTTHLEEVMRALFEGVNQTPSPSSNPPGGAASAFPGLHQLFASVFNPANAAQGDVVYTQEALDRIISQFMDTHNGSSAPGPATAQAISALPKKSVTKEMLGSDGKAECSVCMDNVELGDEVTFLPCGHWFHGECVGAWLKEHDTCPHCRQGIMPKHDSANGEAATQPRAPGQEPRNIQFPPLSPSAAYNYPHRLQSMNRGSPNGSGNPMFRSQQTQSPTTFRSQMELPVPSRSRSERRRSSGSGSSGGRNAGEGSSTGGGISGAIGGWMSRRLGGGGGGTGSRDRSSSR